MMTYESNYPLLVAVRAGDCAAIEEAIRAGAQVDFVDQNDVRLPKLMHIAVESPDIKNKTQVIECLFKNGADVNAVDAYGSSVLHYAIAVIDFETVKCLLSLGAVITAKIAAFAAAYTDYCMDVSPEASRSYIGNSKEIRLILLATLLADKHGSAYREAAIEYVSALEVARYSLTQTS